MMKWIVFFLLIVFLFLQYKLWFEDHSFWEMERLKHEIALQQRQNQQLAQRNKALIAEVKDLKHGHRAIEERARSELGMIKQGEQFYQIVPGPKANKNGNM